MWTVTESATKLKTGNCWPKQREQLRTLNASQTNITSCVTAFMRQLFTPFLAHRYQFWASLPIMHISTFTYQFHGAQLPVFFPVNLEIIVWNITSLNKLRCAIAKLELEVWHYANFVYVISEKISTLMDRTMPNKCTKFGAKLFRSYWVIIFWCWVISYSRTL